MAGKDLYFRFITQGDPSGAKEVTNAIDDATEATRELDQATESLGTSTSSGTSAFTVDLRQTAEAAGELQEAVDDVTAANKKLNATPPKLVEPADVKPAINSLAALSDEVQRLERELRDVPVGGKAFMDLAGQIKEAKERLTEAERQAARLGGVVGKRGNAGMAVLEFSRAFEDAQYGIRGVLNNIPGLIAMLGGGAGLAGVISVAAVLGTQLWEKLSSGADKSKKKTKDYKDELAELTKFFEDLGRPQLDDLETRGRNASAFLDFMKKEADFRERQAKNDDTLEALKARRAAELAIAQEKLALLRQEKELIDAGGESAKKVAAAREASQKRILEIERQLTEELRQQEISALNRAEATAKEALQRATDAKQQAQRSYDSVRETRKGAYDEMSAGQEFRAQLLESLRRDLEAAQKAPASIDNGELIIALKNAITEALQPSPKEMQAQAQLDAGKPQLQTVTDNLNAAAEKQLAAADALKQATENREAKEQQLAVDRGYEQQRREVDEQTAATNKSREKESQTIEGLSSLADELSASEALAPVVQSIRDALADKSLSVEEMERIQGQLSAYGHQIAQLGQDIFNAVKQQRDDLDELGRQFRSLKSQQGNPNP